jgi:uncharacterized protein YjbI with pentapeptide repeats
MAKKKIIGGENPSLTHPGGYNTVAFIKAEDNKIFCTGSLISPNMIATAQHCLIDKKLGDFKVFFGDSTLELEKGKVVEVADFKNFETTDWQMTFPSFDVAWVKLKQDAPAGFRPIPLLSNSDNLAEGMTAHLVGYGNRKADGSVEAGEKFFIETKLKSFHNSSRFQNVLVFETQEGKGSCHGDSGGPAYIQIKNDHGALEWRLIGVTNGFDLVLTPKSMAKTTDPDFPFVVKCEKGQSIYSFLGGYGDWIEKTSQSFIDKDGFFTKHEPVQILEHASLMSWCQDKNVGTPSWNLLKFLMDQKVDTIDQKVALDFYENCNEVVDYLGALESVVIDGEKVIEANISLRNLSLLPKLKNVDIKNLDQSYIDLDLSKARLDKLVLKNLGLDNLEALKLDGAIIKSLNISNNKLTSIDLSKFSAISLESIDISKNKIERIKGLGQGTLKSLEYFGGAKSVHFEQPNFSSMEHLIFGYIDSVHGFRAKDLVNLKSLILNSMSLDSLDLTASTSLKSLEIVNTKLLSSIKLPDHSRLEVLNVKRSPSLLKTLMAHEGQFSSLTTLDLSSTKLANLSWITAKRFPSLAKLSLSSNPIESIFGLSYFQTLSSLKMFGTPLHKRKIELSEGNCPVLSKSTTVNRYCARLRNIE